MALIRKACRFRLEPARRQLPGFVRVAGARRWVWNWALERRIQYYRDCRATLSSATLCRELTRLKRQPDTRWLQEMDAQALREAIRDLDKAFRAFFAKRARFPQSELIKGCASNTSPSVALREPSWPKVCRTRLWGSSTGNWHTRATGIADTLSSSIDGSPQASSVVSVALSTTDRRSTIVNGSAGAVFFTIGTSTRLGTSAPKASEGWASPRGTRRRKTLAERL